MARKKKTDETAEMQPNANIVQINRHPEIDLFTVAFIPGEGLRPLGIISATENDIRVNAKYGWKFSTKKEAENYILWLEKRQDLLNIIASANKYYPPKNPIEYGSRNLFTFWHNGRFGVHNNDSMPQVYPIEFYVDNIEAAHYAAEKIIEYSQILGYNLCKFVFLQEFEAVEIKGENENE
jgi:hypothetical protein